MHAHSALVEECEVQRAVTLEGNELVPRHLPQRDPLDGSSCDSALSV